MLELFLDFWPVFTVLGGALIWLIRLEGRAMSNSKEVGRLWAVRKEDLDRAEQSRQDTHERLKDIEEMLHEGLRTLTQDIKHLLDRKR